MWNVYLTIRPGVKMDKAKSPGKITDFFASKTDAHNGSDSTQDKESSDTASSVYLTPKSSPFKDNEDNHVAENISHSGDSVKLDNCESPSSERNPSENSRVSDLSSSPSGSFEQTSIKSFDTRTPSRLNGCVSNYVISESSKRKSSQHRICHVTRSVSIAVNPEKDHPPRPSPTTDSGSSTTTMSSPLPQPKVRKDSRPRADSHQSLANGKTQTTGAKPKPGRRKKPEPVQSTAITDYFPVRRSGRQTKSQIENDSQVHLEKLIKSNHEEGLQVKEFEGKGRGIVATRIFDKGDFVIEYAGDLLDMDTARDRETQYALTPSIGCYMYFFSHKNKQYCVDATSESGRLGRLINHSRNGNCGTKVVMVEGKPRLILVAAKYIKEGEELSYDYGDRSKAALDAHPWLKL